MMPTSFIKRKNDRSDDLSFFFGAIYIGGFLREERLHAEDMQNAVFDKKLAQEEVWIRQGIKARRTRNMGRVRELYKMREERAARRARMGTATLNVQEAEKSGKLVAEMRSVGFTWPDGFKVFEGGNLIIQRGDKVGLIGDNGAGKTTLLNVIQGKQQPTKGSVRIGQIRHGSPWHQP